MIPFTRRDYLRFAVAVVLANNAFFPNLLSADDQESVINIDNRRELFVDRFLIDQMDNTSLKLHEPRLAAPMENPDISLMYSTVIKDGDVFRLYSRDQRGTSEKELENDVTVYFESRDGIHWKAPNLGLVEIDGSKENNVILREVYLSHTFCPLLDTRPDVPKEERFKALAGTYETGLIALASADGIRWRKLRDEPVISIKEEYVFDSQNVSFWSASEGCYVCYFRYYVNGKWRSVCRTTSTDFINWTKRVPLTPNLEEEHLYTTQTHPYFRAPHIYVATPTRFHPERGKITDILFMTARGNRPFERTFAEAFIRPGIDPARWGNRGNYAVLNVVPTSPSEMSIYSSPFRRFVLRTDGFVSVHARAKQGEMITHPVRFSGQRLEVNYSTSAGGTLQVEIQDADGNPLPGYKLADCQGMYGDAIEQTVEWEKGNDISLLAKRPVRLRFVLQDADLYAIQFREK